MHGLMLPGLGADIESLDKRTAMDWSAAVENAMEELKRHHSLSLARSRLSPVRLA